MMQTARSSTPLRSSRAAMAVLLCASALTVMANATIAPALPELRAAFVEVPDMETLAGLILAMPSLLVIISAGVLGWLSDRLGRRAVLAICMVVYAVGGASGFIAGDLPQILAGRGVLGIGVAGTMTIASAYVADLWQGPARAHYMGLQAGAANLGGIVFVLLGGLLTGLGWRFPFLLYLVGLPLALAALAALPRRPLPSPEPNSAQTEIGAEEEVFPLWRAAWIVPLGLSMMTIFYILPTRLPFQMVALGITSPVAAGFALAMVTLFGLPGSLGYGWLRNRLSVLAIFGGSLAFLGLGLIVIAVATEAGAIFGGAILCGIGFGAMIPNLMNHFLSKVPAELRGRGAGLVTAAVFGGQFLSPLASGFTLQAMPLGTAFGVFGAASLGLGLVFGLAATLVGSSEPHGA